MLIRESKNDISFTQNRELSWLKFNERVLAEANDSTVPLMERLKFLSIVSGNLDEFFMIRVGSLHDLSLMSKEHIDNKSGMTAQEQLNAIYEAVRPMYRNRDKAFWELEKQLRQYKVCNLAMKELEGRERKFIQEYFESYVLPILSPQIVDPHHPFPHLANKALNIGIMLITGNKKRFGIIPVPKSLPRVLLLPGEGTRYVLMEELILKNAENIFNTYQIQEKTILSVTRNADINPNDEAFELEEDFRLRMKKVLQKRARLAPVRLEIQHRLNPAFLNYLCKRLNLGEEQVFQSTAPLDLSYVHALESKLPSETKEILTYTPFVPQHPGDIDNKESMIKKVMDRDILLHYPYESIEPFLRLIKEAAFDPGVVSIKITLYRIDKKSRLAELLIDAADNGKEVTVLMELRARFDERNNIEWAERLEESGCKVIYGFEGFKVHSKICLITRSEKNKIQYITQFGTGNYNEKTAALYSDLSLITADMDLGQDAVLFFKNMSIANLYGHYSHLLVAPSEFKRFMLALMEGEIDKAHNGRPASLLFKLNSLTDRDILDKLYQASQAGVRVRLIVRGICCILPGIPGKTENITVTSIVGRFLEHARIYAFGVEGDMQIYISSADLMTRNTERRVEIACPILDKEIQKRILHILEIQLADNVKARRLLPDKSYEHVPQEGSPPVNSQEYFMKEAIERSKPTDNKTSIMDKLRRILCLGNMGKHMGPPC